MKFNQYLIESSTALSRILHYLKAKLMLQTTLTALVTLLLERLQNDVATAHGCSGSFVSSLHSLEGIQLPDLDHELFEE